MAVRNVKVLPDDVRIGTLDIETLPYEGYMWQLWDTNIANNQLIKDRTVAAFCWKELGKAPVYFDTSKRRNPRDDKALMVKAWDVLDKADVIVTQNGKRFDIPILNARFMQHGMKPPSPYAQVDTRETAKRIFKFASNKLEWLGPVVAGVAKSQHKEFPGFELWTECLARNPKAWAEMKKYNIQDVLATEAVYLKLRPWMTTHPYIGKGAGKCGACGSSHLQHRGYRRTKAFIIERLECQSCGSWATPGARRKA